MRAELLVRRRVIFSENEFVEIVIWKVPRPVRASDHGFKYRLAYIVDNECVLRYDNEAGKGDHRHVGNQELPYRFTGIDRLLPDFFKELERLRQ